MTEPSTHLHIGAIIYPQVDQADFTGPFEVLSRIPNSTFHVLWKEITPVLDVKGLILTPDTTFANSPALDLLVVPGGWGQEALMEDQVVLDFIRAHVKAGKYILSVCTGALIVGAAGLLRGVKTTTHWSSFNLLEYFGALSFTGRVVVDGKFLSTAGVTAGIDGALWAVELLRSQKVAEEIQLSIEYDPEPPFDSGTPELAPADVVEEVRSHYSKISATRLATAKRIASQLGITVEG
ncbi:MAG TPA: DJ-1/PfpI family protein [Terracidiphilus sp.]|nr:DJ-1/PfpI family protein [Terracidiphilus sp.]